MILTGPAGSGRCMMIVQSGPYAYRKMVKFEIMLLMVVLAACTSGGPSLRYREGALLQQDDFSEAFGWDSMTYENIAVGIHDGAYEMRSDRSQFVRGFNVYSYSDVVIQVDARQLSAYQNNAYGVICRATPSDNAKLDKSICPLPAPVK